MTPREFPKSRLALPSAVLAVLAVLGIALWVRADPASPPFQGLDDAWLRFLDGPREGPLWTAADAFHHGGGRPATIAMLLFALALTAVRRWRSALFAVAAFLATYALTYALKHLGGRPRPEEVMVAVSSPAFPSGHSSRMACLVVILAVVAVPAAARRLWWPIGALLVLGMMWARTWQHAHWLTDTIGGAAVGLGVSVLCWRAFDPMLRRERQERAAGAGGPAQTHEARSGMEDLSSAAPPPARGRPMSNWIPFVEEASDPANWPTSDPGDLPT